MVRADKAAAVAELTESFRSASAAMLTEYRGLTVAQLKELRRALSADATYSVVKNTLTRIAVREAGMTELEPWLEGPSAVAFVTGDPVSVAKGIRDFAKAHPALIVKGGLLDGRPLSADDIRKLADLESREVLLAKLAGAMKGSLQQAVALFVAPLAQAARLAGALQAKAEADPSILAGGAGTPVPAPADEAPAGTPDETQAETEAPAEAQAEASAADAQAEAPAEAQADAPAETTTEPPGEAAAEPAAGADAGSTTDMSDAGGSAAADAEPTS